MSENLPTLFPALRTSAFRITSPAETRYNCIAWAANDTSQWWWPVEGAPWPPSAVRELTLDAFAGAFQTLGYLAAAAGVPTHAARQLPTGRWTSKLGQEEDIEHDLRALEGEIYGAVASILKRPLPPDENGR